MRAADYLAAAEHLPYRDLEQIAGGGGLVVVAPHPDDESLGCGGLIAEACRRGVPVRLVVVSDGAASHPGSERYPADRLRALRERETLAAAAELGLPPSDIDFLRLPDRHVPVSGARAEAAKDSIVAAASACRAGAVCVTWGWDPHCDHQAAAALVEGARDRLHGARLFAYPVWGWTLTPDTEVAGPPRGLRFDIKPHLERKAAAIAAHRSQTTDLIDDDPNGFRLTEAMIAHFLRPYEILLAMDAPPA